MQEKGGQNDGFGPLSICHRLFNFIMNSFLTRGRRRVTLGTSNALLLHDDGSRSLEKTEDREKLIRSADHEILVEFKHTNGSLVNRRNNSTSGQVLVEESWRSTKASQKTGLKEQGNNTSGQVLAKENGRLTKASQKTGLQGQGNSNGGRVLLKDNGNSTKPLKRTGLQDQGNSNGGRILLKQNGTSTNTHQKTGSQDQGDSNGRREKATKISNVAIVEGENLPGWKPHLLNVTSNINEKADAFIRSRKEAMKDFEPETPQ